MSEPNIIFSSLTQRSLEEVLKLWDEGILTRGEFVSELASHPEIPLDDPKLAADVAELRQAIAEGKTFILGSRC